MACPFFCVRNQGAIVLIDFPTADHLDAGLRLHLSNCDCLGRFSTLSLAGVLFAFGAT